MQLTQRLAAFPAAMRKRALPSWWLVAVIVAVTSPLAVYWWQLIAEGSVAFDWRIFVEAGERAWRGSPDLYEVNAVYSFRHSPLMAFAMPAIAWIGTLGIRLVTLAAAVAMPTWPMRLLALASWPFVVDVQHGTFITLIVCVAAWALRGRRWASIAYLALALLSPRPLMLPVAAWLIWRQPDIRPAAALLVLANAVGVVATGYADDWAQMLLNTGTDMIEAPFNLAPSRVIGAAWVPIGLVLAAWLTIRGRIGLAALAANPYILPHYLLFVLIELDRRRGGVSKPSAAAGS